MKVIWRSLSVRITLPGAGDDHERGLAAGPAVLHPEGQVPAVGVDRPLLDEDLPREVDLHEVVLEEAEGLRAARGKGVLARGRRCAERGEAMTSRQAARGGGGGGVGRRRGHARRRRKRRRVRVRGCAAGAFGARRMSLTGRSGLVRGAACSSMLLEAARDVLGQELRGVVRLAACRRRQDGLGVAGSAGAASRPPGGPPAAILSSTRRTMRFAPAWRYW